MIHRCKVCTLDKWIPPSYARRRHWICTSCHNASPAARRARAKWVKKRRQTAEGKAYEKALDARRVRYYDKNFGYAATAADAQAMTAHIRRRMLEFKSRQSSRAETEGDPDGAVATEAATGDD